ncbi:MAG: hypothetical protein HXX08_11490 [Chloroflexi bacterium]|uniref:Uncharacterized protein n=1 Tax=Candidatus Chlorohelix allophototropha TaxID=3003348 RepID=A0A8T7LZG5_9CHLR|nr:hypothetical protein [Chloroflexota bacterium]WJW65861.1 hypothetical protein OZ401_001640 [Chloroflexota bacterium L227-S17]
MRNLVYIVSGVVLVEVVLAIVVAPIANFALLLVMLCATASFAFVGWMLTQFLRNEHANREYHMQTLRMLSADRTQERASLYADRAQERAINTQSQMLIAQALAAGVYLATRNNRDVLVYPDGEILDAKLDCKMTDDQIKFMQEKQVEDSH